MGELKRLVRQSAQRIVGRYGWELRKTRSSAQQSETSKCRPRLACYCKGYGIDVGSGRDPITPSAIRVDMPTPYSDVGPLPVQLGGGATNLYWFADEMLDYVYSSHLLEDFDPVEPVLQEWIRVLKPGGSLIIFCPDQAAYSEHCLAIGEGENPHHENSTFSVLDKIRKTRVVDDVPLIDIYSWELVAIKIGSYADDNNR
jgi:predicted SAM-dependent methyltransferase